MQDSEDILTKFDRYLRQLVYLNQAVYNSARSNDNYRSMQNAVENLGISFSNFLVSTVSVNCGWFSLASGSNEFVHFQYLTGLQDGHGVPFQNGLFYRGALTVMMYPAATDPTAEATLSLVLGNSASNKLTKIRKVSVAALTPNATADYYEDISFNNLKVEMSAPGGAIWCQFGFTGLRATYTTV